MNKQKLALILVVNCVVIITGFALADYNLWMRRYKPIKVEYYPLGYRPTYLVKNLVVRGSWTLDFLQLGVVAMAVLDLVYALKWVISRVRRSSMHASRTS